MAGGLQLAPAVVRLSTHGDLQRVWRDMREAVEKAAAMEQRMAVGLQGGVQGGWRVAPVEAIGFVVADLLLVFIFYGFCVFLLFSCVYVFCELSVSTGCTMCCCFRFAILLSVDTLFALVRSD